MRFVLKRLARCVLLLLGVSLLSFVFTSLAPGDYFEEMQMNPQIAPEAVRALRAHFGLSVSWPVRYVRWLK
ncbi:MAG TPA: hypothetical protein VHM88_15330, partial [Candidatus Acidoferrales bacterium]|nr:hypothetical protein [Candidatus Acidoferrales bacterium]